ncbi:ABC transporter ATP-binding protein [Microbacterium sp.]|uniref:ABC transporter ATP-binding protein n=1 Tax=Microbacterium sp. TaxID=51671 RepID=UPI003C7698FE
MTVQTAAHPATENPSRQETDAAPIAEAIGVRRHYGRADTLVPALDGIDVRFGRGRFTAIMGPSGSGKSTLMHCMAGLDRPDSGEVHIDGRRIDRLSESALTKLRRTKLGFVFQSFNLVPTLTARENIELPLTIARRKADPVWFDRIIDAVGLSARLGHRPDQLSGGQQQRVACARALLGRPAIVFADEPTGNLDSTASESVLSFLRTSVTELGQSIVMVTHEPSAAAYADRVLFLADGRIVDDLADPTEDLILSRLRMASSAVAASTATVES